MHFFATEVGGRATATPVDKFGCLLVFEDELFDCRLYLDDIGSIEPGQSKEVIIGFLSPDLIISRLKLGTLFHLRDGNIIAHGVVREIYR